MDKTVIKAIPGASGDVHLDLVTFGYFCAASTSGGSLMTEGPGINNTFFAHGDCLENTQVELFAAWMFRHVLDSLSKVQAAPGNLLSDPHTLFVFNGVAHGPSWVYRSAPKGFLLRDLIAMPAIELKEIVRQSLVKV